MEAAGKPALFSTKGLQGALMEWAMRDDRFKTQLFRFVDVLPALTSGAEITRHLQEYLGTEEAHLPAGLRTALKAASGAAWLAGGAVKAQVASLAHQFILGSDPHQILSALRQLREQAIDFTLDVLGETVVSEAEADQYADRYVGLIGRLAVETEKWSTGHENGAPNLRSAGFGTHTQHPADSSLARLETGQPVLNFSVKVSALYSQIHPADPETAIERLSSRLRPILRQARETGAFINFDMESYALKNLTLRLFESIFAEPEFASAPACGIALQAYLRDCEADLDGLIEWARSQHRQVTVRLVKGAYWDYETVIAAQRGWPVPVFNHKAETDANFEALTVKLLENQGVVLTALGTHNVRSIAHALAQADRLGVYRRDLEFQMLRGMADPIKAALLKLDCRVREYCPVGDLLPGMAYFVRRLLENTSNEGFLASAFAKSVSHQELLRNPRELLKQDSTADNDGRQERCGTDNGAATTSRGSRLQEHSSGRVPGPDDAERAAHPTPVFRNEPPTDFNVPEAREKVSAAITELRRHLGRKQPLVINNKAVMTQDWLASLNPANQKEIIGYSGQATVPEAETALAAAHAAQPRWARTPAGERAAVLERTASLMRRDKAALCALEILEAGKNWSEADADVAEAIDFCNFYAAEMRSLGEPRRTQRVAGESDEQHWRARGVGVVIAPWNFPLAILAGMSAAAIVSGNAVLLKPSDQTPILGSRFMDLLIEAGLHPGIANLVTGPGSTVGAHLVAHAKVDFIAFTGSKEVGLKIWELAGQTRPGQVNLKKVVCEMGGKNAVIVDSDADLDEAVSGCLNSAFGYQGQKCSALSRLIVLEGNYDRFLERFIAAAASMRIGPAEVPGNLLGPVINREAQQQILRVIEAGRKEARLAWQGKVPDDPNACYLPPTIFTEVPRGARLFREEIFGPVLAITPAKNFEEALSLANDSEFALTGGCYSRSPVNIERAKSEMVCGNLYINRGITGAIVERQPFGGFKMSGGGTKAGGREYLQNFMVPRVIAENRLRRGFAANEE